MRTEPRRKNRRKSPQTPQEKSPREGLAHPPSELFISALATDARGIAKEGGKVTFVAGALPGETVLAAIDADRKTYREAVTLEVLKPSPDRTTPLCVHYGRCGGCQLQHAHHATHQAMKTQWCLETLRRLGRWPEESMSRVRASFTYHAGEKLAYRQRLRVHFDGSSVGFRTRGGRAIEDVTRCHIAHQVLQNHWDAIKNHLGVWWHAQSQRPAGFAAEIEITAQVDATSHPAECLVFEVVTCSHQKEQKLLQEALNHLPFASPDEALRIYHPFCSDFRVHRKGFLQPHRDAIASYTQCVFHLLQEFFARLPNSSQREVWDLYAGSGVFSVLPQLASPSVSVKTFAVEGIGPAVQSLKGNTNPTSVTAVCSSVDDFLRQQRTSPQVVILDPPRAGAGIDTMGLLLNRLSASSSPTLMIYVACDAASLARDGKLIIDAGFEPTSIFLFDMFPQTTHYEVICAFSRP